MENNIMKKSLKVMCCSLLVCFQLIIASGVGIVIYAYDAEYEVSAPSPRDICPSDKTGI